MLSGVRMAARRCSGVLVVAVLVQLLVAVASAVPAEAAQAPATAPSAPTSVQAIGVNTGIAASWSAPYSGGAVSITQYVVTASPGGGTCVVSASGGDTCTVANLANGTAYQISVLDRHNPPVYFTNLANCSTDDVPFAAGDAEAGNPLYNDVMSGNLPTTSSVTPNSIDDGHYSPGGTNSNSFPLENQDTDAWLQTWLPIITSGPDYQSGNLTILVMWDEGYGANVTGGFTPSYPPLLVLSPYVKPGATDSNGVTYTALSVTKAVDDIAGLAELNGAASAPSLRSAFNF